MKPRAGYLKKEARLKNLQTGSSRKRKEKEKERFKNNKVRS